MFPDRVGDIIVERAGMGLPIIYPEVGQKIENLPWFDFQFARQLVNSDLHITAGYPLVLPLFACPGVGLGIAHHIHRIRFNF